MNSLIDSPWLLLPAIFLVLAFSVPIASLFRFNRIPSHLLAIYLLTWGDIVLVSEIAALFESLNKQHFLVLHMILAFIGLVLWNRGGYPSLLGPVTRDMLRITYVKRLLPFSGTALGFLTLAVATAYISSGLIILLVPPNNYDSMTYHLSRVAYWLQNENLAPWNTFNPRQTTFPINAELGILWLVMFRGQDQLAGFVQWTSALACVISIFGTARLLKASRSQSLFACLIFASFTEVFLQSSTTQNDLVVAAFLVTAIFFLAQGLMNQERHALLVSGLSMGLSAGTKTTIVYILPGLTVFLLLWWSQNGSKGFHRILKWGIASLVGFILFGSFIYIQNWIAYNNPLGIREWTEGVINSEIPRGTFLIGNGSLMLYQALDITGLPPQWASALAPLKYTVGEWLFSALKVPIDQALTWSRYLSPTILYAPSPIHEDFAWFGPLSVLVFFPSIIVGIVRGIRRKDMLHFGLAIIPVLFWASLAISMGWSFHKNRYFVLAIAAGAPLMAFLYSNSRRTWLWRWSIALLAGLVMLCSLIFNVSKPLVGEDAVWGQEPLLLQTRNNPSMYYVMQMVNNTVNQAEPLVIMTGLDSWDYLLFGPRLQRTIIPIGENIDLINGQWLDEKQARYLLIAPERRSFLAPPVGLNILGITEGWVLLGRETEILTPPESKVLEFLLGLSDPRKLISIDNRMARRAGLIALNPAYGWIDQENGQGYYWMGEGEAQGIKAYIWSEDKISITITLEVDAGPARDDPTRNIGLTVQASSNLQIILPVAMRQSFTGKSTLTFSADFQPGLNVIGLFGLDPADVRPSVDASDDRVKLIRVNSIKIIEDRP